MSKTKVKKNGKGKPTPEAKEAVTRMEELRDLKLKRNQIAAALQQEMNERIQACSKEIDEALQKHRCQLAAAPQLTQDGRIVARVTLDAAPPGE